MKRMLAVCVIALLSACTQIDTGNVGVESVWGQIKQETLPQGVYFTLFKKMYEISAKENVIELLDMKPKTSDNITLADLDINVYYQIGANNAAKIMSKYAGDMVQSQSGDLILGSGLVSRLTREATYIAVSKYNSSIAHTKRTEIAEDTLVSLQKELNEKAGKDMFIVTNIIVRNLLTDAGLESSIKESAQVEFNIRKNKQQIELARSESERQRVEAEGIARANTIISNSLTDKLIEMKRVENMKEFAKAGTHTVLIPQNTQPFIQVK